MLGAHLEHFRHYTDDELQRFVEASPGHLAAEGEPIKRITGCPTTRAWRDAEREAIEEERDSARGYIETAAGYLEDVKLCFSDLKDAIEVLRKDNPKADLSDLDDLVNNVQSNIDLVSGELNP